MDAEGSHIDVQALGRLGDQPSREELATGRLRSDPCREIHSAAEVIAITGDRVPEVCSRMGERKSCFLLAAAEQFPDGRNSIGGRSGAEHYASPIDLSSCS